jgi:hypothetical protein
MPAEVQSRTGLKPVRRGTAPLAECGRVATEPGKRLNAISADENTKFTAV